MAGSNVSLKSTLLAFWRIKWQSLKIRIFSSPPPPSGFPASFENHNICQHNSVLSSCCCCYLSCFALLGQTRALLLLFSCWVMSDSLQPHGLQPARLLCLWDFPSKNTGLGCSSLLQGILPIQILILCLLLGRQTLYFWATWEALTHADLFLLSTPGLASLLGICHLNLCCNQTICNVESFWVKHYLERIVMDEVDYGEEFWILLWALLIAFVSKCLIGEWMALWLSISNMVATTSHMNLWVRIL